MIYSILYWTYAAYIHNIKYILCYIYCVIYIMYDVYIDIDIDIYQSLEWVVISFSRRYSSSWDQTQVSCFAGRFFTIWTTREAPYICIYVYVYYTHIYIYMHIIFSLSFHLPQTLRLSSLTIANNAAMSI